jgi:hypothetical protein
MLSVQRYKTPETFSAQMTAARRSANGNTNKYAHTAYIAIGIDSLSAVMMANVSCPPMTGG